MNWVIWIDMYTLMCIKLMTNKNLLYKKKKKEEDSHPQGTHPSEGGSPAEAIGV